MGTDTIQRLQDRIEELEALLGISDDEARRYQVLGLQPIPLQMLSYIVKRKVATREGIYIAVYGNRQECDQPAITVVNQHLWRIRNVLEPHGIYLKTEIGAGYSITPEHKAKLEKVLARLKFKPKNKRLGIQAPGCLSGVAGR